jgi:Fic family protein
VEYVHQLEGWPDFRWREPELAVRLAAVRNHQGRLTGRMGQLGFRLQAEAVLETLAEEVTQSSAIEGESLDKDQVRSSLARHLGMDAAGLSPADRNVEGIVEMMLDATQNYAAPLDEERLLGWHAALFPAGFSGMRRITVGAWRTDEVGPMQVVSGPVGRERVHFEAPAASRVPHEMRAFLSWFNTPDPGDPVLNAAIAHLWFVTIHPFDDGNGRIARAIADMALARSESSPRRFYSMSAQIRAERKAYYEVLERTQKGGLDITLWLEWFLDCLDRAFAGADDILAAVLRKARFWQSQAGAAFSERQSLMLNRLLDGFEGKLTSSKWAAITKTSQDTASRDIDDLIRRHVLFREPGGGRSTSYGLLVTVADPLHAAAEYARLYSEFAVSNGPKSPNIEERARRRETIHALADQIDTLAQASLHERVTAMQFDTLREALRAQGFTIDGQLVSAAAFAFHRDENAPPLLATRSS